MDVKNAGFAFVLQMFNEEVMFSTPLSDLESTHNVFNEKQWIETLCLCIIMGL